VVFCSTKKEKHKFKPKKNEKQINKQATMLTKNKPKQLNSPLEITPISQRTFIFLIPYEKDKQTS